jgi:hypothetical protein
MADVQVLAEADGFGLISDGERFAVIQARLSGDMENCSPGDMKN